MTHEVRLVWPLGALLGEGPFWAPQEQALYFVDIKGGRLHRYQEPPGRGRTFHVGGRPSFVVPNASGGLLLGSEHGVWVFKDGALGPCVATLDHPAHNRTNDATVDPQGRLWFGTMDDQERAPTGALWRLDREGLRRMGPEAIVTNGPAVTADGRTLYHVDSSARRILRHEIRDDGSLGPGAVFIAFTQAEGFPDGVTLDAEACLWVALWDGWGVRRYRPDGTLAAEVRLPCARVTKIAFGGADLRTAYVTTARVGLDDAACAAQPHAGGLFAFEAPAPGRPLPGVRLG